MEETTNRALQLLDRLMDRPRVNIEAFKRVADICDEEEEPLSGADPHYPFPLSP
jgi:hypothetical protein